MKENPRQPRRALYAIPPAPAVDRPNQTKRVACRILKGETRGGGTAVWKLPDEHIRLLQSNTKARFSRHRAPVPACPAPGSDGFRARGLRAAYRVNPGARRLIDI